MSKFYISGRNQTKTVTPSNVQQTVSPDTGYNALDAVVVNPIKAAMPQTIEQFIMRDDNMEPFSLNLDGVIPSYACYFQSNLIAVYGRPTYISQYAFYQCSKLQEFDFQSVTLVGTSAFQNCSSLQKVDGKLITALGDSAFSSCSNLQTVDCRQAQTIGRYSFQSCANLEAVDCRTIARINGAAFQYDSKFILIDITETSTATLADTYALPNNANLVILVANDTDKAHYQSTTNWSAFASKIKTVAEYEQQIGMSYDDYYEIIFGHPRFDNAA